MKDIWLVMEHSQVSQHLVKVHGSAIVRPAGLHIHVYLKLGELLVKLHTYAVSDHELIYMSLVCTYIDDRFF